VTSGWNFNANLLAETDPLYRQLNTAMAKTVTRAQARFADVFPLFNPPGNVTRERARLCVFTFACSRGDPHPTDAGYRAIAAAVWKASGY
jgi:hypothetical protein